LVKWLSQFSKQIEFRHHFEQSFHVCHRLKRYRAGRRMDFGTDGPSQIAAAIAEEIGRRVERLVPRR
jgi:hypothetical protein